MWYSNPARLFTWRLRSTLQCWNVVKVFRREIAEIVRYLPHRKKNKNLVPSQTVATAPIAPKVCQGQLPTFGSQCCKCHPNRFTFGGAIAERVKAVLLSRRVNPCASNTFEANNKLQRNWLCCRSWPLKYRPSCYTMCKTCALWLNNQLEWYLLPEIVFLNT